MLLEINDLKTIRDVQKDFAVAYPFLKIEFFRNGTVRQDRYPAEKLIAHTAKLSEAGMRGNLGELELNDIMTVFQLESIFMDNFGLSIQVFRKSGPIWLETTLTDHWTLKQQNDHGREISTGSHKKYPGDEEDYELNRDASH